MILNRPKIIFHLGLPKCASTFIQNVILKNNNFKNNFEFKADFRNYFFFKDPLDMELVEYLKSFTNEKNYFLSDETFFGDIRGKHKVFPNSLKAINNFENQFYEKFDLNFVLIIRPIEEIFISISNQLAKQSGKDSYEILQKFNEDHFNAGHLITIIKKLKKIGKIKIYYFKDIIADDRKMLFNFLNYINLDLTLFDHNEEKNKKVNPSLSNKGLKILKNCKPILSNSEYLLIRKFVTKYFVKTEIDNFEKDFINKYKILSEKFMKDIEDNFSDSIEQNK